MPEMKRNFTKGKMNKDRDERLIPQGEYRDAMNIQVTTSEGSDVGTIQNVLGNTPGCEYWPQQPSPILRGSSTVGSVSDEKNDTLYWLVAGPNSIDDVLPLNIGQDATLKDMIMRTNPDVTNDCEPIFVDKHGWCIGIDDDSTNNAITFTNTALYENITPGMEVFGYSGTTVQSGFPAQVIGIGTQDQIGDFYYYQGRQNSSSNPIPVTINMSQRMFDESTCFGNIATPTDYSRFTPCQANPGLGWSAYNPCGTNSHCAGSTPTPGTGYSQIVTGIPTPPELIVGSVISNSAQYPNGATVVAIDFDLICQGANGTNCNTAAIITLDVVPTGPTINNPPQPYTDEVPFTTGTCDVSLPVITTTTPHDNIRILPSSQQWLDEVYHTLWDANGLQTGVWLQIEYSAAINFPPDTCIDPNSVIQPGDGFDLSIPSYDDHWVTVGCPWGANAGSNVNALNLNETPPKINLPFRLTAYNWDGVNATPGGGMESIILNETVDLSSSDALCFTSERVLEFDHDNLITGINIVDDMLFWTDNFTEPKKINIPRSAAGTYHHGNTHTAIINDATGLSLANYSPIRREHVTVIRKSPKNALNLELSTERDPSLNYSGVTYTAIDPSLNMGLNVSSIIKSSNNTVISDFSTLQVGDTVTFEIETDANGNEDFQLEWDNSDIILLKEFDIDSLGNATAPTLPLTDFTIRGRITNWPWTSFINDTSLQDPGVPTDPHKFGSGWNGGVSPSSAFGTAHVEIEVLSLNGTPPEPDPNNLINPISLNYLVDLEIQADRIFENKFPRFSYRYKYADGEYSTFAPWSEVAFMPSAFNYDPTKGWNTGMINHLTSVKFKGFVPTVLGQPIGQDVIEVDILYKEEGSPNVYVVETLSNLDISYPGVPNAWQLNEYEITSETIKNTLPSNQLLRPWDNVPKKALAQDVSGNRIIYANYEQNYDLKIQAFGPPQKFKPQFRNYLSTFSDINPGQVEKSIKSLRDYKLGVVFTDEYGRETPILISESGGFKVEKKYSENANRLVAGFDGVAPSSMMYFKFFIKETSTEYYNLAMDRWYNAEDGNIWLSFPSNDRNKVDLETSLYFKKGDDAIENTTRYKILALENEAPEFIKTRQVRIGKVEHNVAAGTPLFGTIGTDAPQVDGIDFTLKYDPGFSGSSISDLHEVQDDLYVQFVTGNDYSSQYKVAEITRTEFDYTETTVTLTNQIAAAEYFVTLDTNLKEDINFIFDNPANPGVINDGVQIRIIKSLVENKPIFEGRFFAKIENDGRIKSQISSNNAGVNYLVRAGQMVYKLQNDDQLKERSLQAALSNVYHTYTGNSSYLNANAITQSYAGTVHPNYQAGQPPPFGSQNINGENINNWIARVSYFKGMPMVGYTAFDKFKTYVRYQSNSGGVWFIDESTHKHYMYSGNDGDQTTMSWPNDSFMFHTTPPYPSGNSNPFWSGWSVTNNIGQGVVNWNAKSSMNLSKGGLGFLNGGAVTNTGDTDGFLGIIPPRFHGVWEEFFAVGEDGAGFDGQNDAGTVRFVNRIKAGFQFKWEHDPTQTIYTFINQRNIFNHVRFSRRDFPISSGGNEIHRNDMLTSVGTYHRRWRQELEPAMNTNGWDPTSPIGTVSGDPGMDNGLELRDISLFSHTIKSSSNAVVGSTYDVNEIEVDKITSECYNGNSPNNEIYTLHKGMMLTDTDVTNVQTSGVAPTGAVPISNQNIIIKHISDFDTNACGGAGGYTITLTGYKHPLHYYPGTPETGDIINGLGTRFLVFKQVSMNGASNFTESNTDLFKDYWTNDDESDKSGGIGAVGYRLQMVEGIDEFTEGGNFPEDPYIWETEPKENTGLDIYYEISENNPITLNANTIISAIPVGSKVENTSGFGLVDWTGVSVSNNISALGDTIVLGGFVGATPGVWIGPGVFNFGAFTLQPIQVGDYLKITKPNGVAFDVRIAGITTGVAVGSGFAATEFQLDTNIYNSDYYLNWHNCYSFGNGVESNRIKDNFNLPYIANGIKASTTLDTEYKQERRKSGLIYSGIYNSTSGVNNLNQFIAAEKITKDINPIYGSIQKLKAGWGQGGDLVALCEDRVLRILANKDALFNADGNTNVTATNRVLGTATPYTGEYGISKNPESFASESYRAYFTDKVRGTVMRLSTDGLTPISDHGMKDWFRDNLKLHNRLIGSYDDKKDEYNITLVEYTTTFDGLGNVIPPNNYLGKTVTFKEDVRGWVSFKSFVTENAISCANNYYSFRDGSLWKHHHDVAGNRNTFYNVFTKTSFEVILNSAPGSVKSFHTLNYEGSQSKVDQFVTATVDDRGFPIPVTSDNQYHNLTAKDGWYVDSIKTNKEEGSLDEFIEKEGKWFNYIGGNDIRYNITSSIVLENEGYSSWDQDSFAIQGLGALNGAPSPATILGCTNPGALNYNCIPGNTAYPCNDGVNLDDGSCIYTTPILGCLDPNGTAVNSDCAPGSVAPCTDNVNTDDGSCYWLGCPDGMATNTTLWNADAQAYSALWPNNSVLVDDGSCIYPVLGCTDSTAFNYDPLATQDDPNNPCVPVVEGCVGQEDDNAVLVLATQASNYNWPVANTDDGSCLWSYCDNPLDANNLDTNYNPVAIDEYTLNGSSSPYVFNNGGSVTTTDCVDGGCTDSNAINPTGGATWDDGSCIYPSYNCSGAPNYNCIDPLDGSGTYSVANGNNNPLAACNSTCTAPASWNCVGNSCIDPGDGSGLYSTLNDCNTACNPIINGCTTPTACNYDASANNDDGSCVDCGGYVSTLITNTTPTGFNTNDGTIVIEIVAPYNFLNNACYVGNSPLISTGFVPQNAGGVTGSFTSSAPVFSTTNIPNDTVTLTFTNVGNIGCNEMTIYDGTFFNNGVAQCPMYSNVITNPSWPCEYEGIYYYNTPNNMSTDSCQDLSNQASPPGVWSDVCGCCWNTPNGLIYDASDNLDGNTNTYTASCAEWGCSSP